MRIMTVALVAAVIFCLACTPKENNEGVKPQAERATAEQANSACTPPTTVVGTPEETAWRILVAATCPVNSNKYPYVVWENWIEQNQLYNVAGALQSLAPGQRPRFHMSPLARIIEEKRKHKGKVQLRLLVPEIANQGCGRGKFSGRTICEEVRIDPSVQGYLVNNKLTTLQGEKQFVKAGNAFSFPPRPLSLKQTGSS
jgi:hypothetical protein